MKKKQLLAALLAGTCAVSMAVPTFAAGDTVTLGTQETAADQNADDLKDFTMNVSTEVQKPTLKVTLPNSTSVLVNPYRIEIDIDGTNTSFDTVLSPEMEIENNSGCAIKVGVKGMIQTYAIGDVASMTAVDTTKYDLDPTSTLTGVTLADLKTADNKSFYIDSDGKQVTATVKAPTYEADKTTIKTKGSIKLTGYTASKDIKVNTAAIKDVDAEKSNTLFIYVEGKQADGEWASAFDAKAVAGVKDTKTGTMSTTGMMALTAKETSQNILYLNAGETGNVRVTGQAATAPTKPWMTLADKFETPFTFVIDAVANRAPIDPNVTNIALTASAGTLGAYTFDKDTLSYTLDWTGAAQNNTLTIAATESTGAKVTITSSDSNFTVSGNVITAGNVRANDSTTITVKFENKGKPAVTYTFAVTVK